MKNVYLLISCYLLFSTFLLANVINVPTDQPTIQAGIDAAQNGDIVLVADSTYYENINFKGKAITVASHFYLDSNSTHIDSTIIDGSQPNNPDSGSVVSFISGEDTTSILCGFTITGGTGTYSPAQPPNPSVRSGGGINCEFSGARICHNKIQYNTITYNSGVAGGGGINAGPPGNTSWIIMEKNTIRWNSINGMLGGGGGVSLTSNAKVYNNVIENNTGQASQNIWGGGIMMGSGDPTITIPYERFVIGNFIRFNKALNSGTGQGIGGGLAVSTSPKAIIKYNTITHNEVQSNAGMGVRCYGGGVILQNQNAETVFANNYVAYNKALPNSICWGAGVTLWSYAIPCNPYLINNIITDNTNGTNGGGIYIGGLYDNEPTLINNTITQDSATYGGAVYSSQSHPVIINSILWNNSSGIYQDGGVVAVRYSDAQGWIGGEGNIDVDPQFIPGDSLYHLTPDPSNPCVNTGADSLQINGQWYFCPPEDYYGDVRPFPGTPTDIGADETDVIIGIDPLSATNIPREYKLHQNYPNPFNPNTTIEFQIANSEFVTLKIYNLLGQEVATLFSERLTVGKYKYDWDASNLASGVYFYKIQTGEYVKTKKLLLIK